MILKEVRNMNVKQRFLEYVAFDTMSEEASATTPSSLKQLKLANYLVEECKKIGLQNPHVDEYGIVYANLSANVEGLPSIGFIAHMDTSPDMGGKDIKPRVIEKYDGSAIILNKELGISMDTEMFESLKEHIGKTLIVTDGTTLLGADDKAGIAEIMTMAETLISKNLPHGNICIAFTPDEEVGRGTDHFNIEKFGADFAYTVDGGEVNSVDYECFNAASAMVHIQGASIHPGSAKGKMRNASLIAMEFHSLLPVFMNPAYTEGYEGFNHLTDMQGECEQATLSYIIRNHDEACFEKQKQDFYHARDYLNQKYPKDTVQVDITDSYGNMRMLIEKDMRIVDLVKNSMREIGLEPTSQAIRGGTDGARLTFEGLPCPNLGTGGYNFHGKYEYACVEEMETSVRLLLKIVENSTKL